MEKIIITGGPGTGKTSILEHLAQQGYQVVDETAREVIKEEQKKYGHKPFNPQELPLEAYQRLQESIFNRQVAAERNIELQASLSHDVVFLDRSIIDGYAYLAHRNIPSQQYFHLDLVAPYSTPVFIIEPLPFHVKDRVRAEDEQEAKALHERIRQTYASFGFPIVAVPFASVPDRAAFILETLAQKEVYMGVR